MNEQQVLEEFKAAQAILKGHFVLSSGKHSDTYLQCARVLMDTQRAQRVCGALAEKVRKSIDVAAIDTVAAPAMGGLIVGYELARQLGKPSVFCERQDGIFTFRRGLDFAQGARVLVVEDVVTTGLSSREAFKCIADQGGVVVAEAALVDRSNGTVDLGVPFIPLVTVQAETFDADKVPEYLQGTPAVKPGSRGLK